MEHNSEANKSYQHTTEPTVNTQGLSGFNKSNEEENNVTSEEIANTVAKATGTIKSEKTTVNKRIDFDKNTYKKLEMMLAVYRDEIDDLGAGQNEVMSYVIGKAINKLFKDDFMEKIVNL